MAPRWRRCAIAKWRNCETNEAEKRKEICLAGDEFPPICPHDCAGHATLTALQFHWSIATKPHYFLLRQAQMCDKLQISDIRHPCDLPSKESRDLRTILPQHQGRQRVTALRRGSASGVSHALHPQLIRDCAICGRFFAPEVMMRGDDVWKSGFRVEWQVDTSRGHGKCNRRVHPYRSRVCRSLSPGVVGMMSRQEQNGIKK